MTFTLFWLKSLGLVIWGFAAAAIHGAGGLQGAGGVVLLVLTLALPVFVWLHLRRHLKRGSLSKP